MTIEKYELGGYKLRLFEYRNRWALEIKKGSARKIISLKTKDLDIAKDEFYKYKLELKEKGRLNILFDTDLFRQIEIFLEWSKTNSNSPRTYRRHKESMDKFSEFLKAKRITKLSHTCYEKFKSYLLDKDLSPRTVDIHLTAVSKLVTVLENIEHIPKGVYPRPTLIRAKRAKAPQFWTLEEIDRVLQATNNSYLQNMIKVGLNTGLRRSELLHLRWEDIHFEGRFMLIQGYEMKCGNETIRFDPKDHELRRIKMNQQAVDVFLQEKIKNNPSPLVFPNKYGRLRRNNIDRDLRLFLKKAGVTEKGTWHAIRRTFATHLVMAGADLESIRQLLGHSEIKTTMAYLNVTSQHLDKTVDLIELGKSTDNKKVVSFRGKD
jgi:site-specific recombinase XerD